LALHGVGFSPITSVHPEPIIPHSSLPTLVVTRKTDGRNLGTFLLFSDYGEHWIEKNFHLTCRGSGG